MIDKDKITEAAELMDCILDLHESYEKLEQPNTHLDICTMVDNRPTSSPLCETIAPDVQKLIEIRMNEKWSSLRKIFDEGTPNSN